MVKGFLLWSTSLQSPEGRGRGGSARDRISDRLAWVNREYGVVALLWFLSLIHRLMLSVHNYGFIRPDEVFQSVEVVHYHVFGYGKVPPEFQRPEGHILISSSYYMSRSPIFPFLFFPLMWGVKLLGLDYFDVFLPLFRVVLAVNASLLIPSLYYFGRSVTGSRGKSWSVFVLVFFALTWWQFAFFGIRSLTNTVYTPWLFFLLGKYLRGLEKKRMSPWEQVWVPLVIAIMVYTRLDLLITIFAVLVCFGSGKLVKENFTAQMLQVKERLAWNFVGVLIGLLTAGSVDYWYYGVFFISPVNWFRFNVLEGHASRFGVSRWTGYLYYLFIQSPSNLVLLLFSLGVFSRGIWKVWKTMPGLRVEKARRALLKIITDDSYLGLGVQGFTAFLFSIMVYSSAPHKEARFIFNTIVLLFWVYSQAVGMVLEELVLTQASVFGRKPPVQGKSKVPIRAVFLIGLLASMFILVSWWDSQQEDFYVKDDLNKSLVFVGQRSDSRGVILGNIWYYDAGGYTYLHKDIPYVHIPDLREQKQHSFFLELVNTSTPTYNYVILPLETSSMWYQGFQAELSSLNFSLAYKNGGYVVYWHK